MTAQPYLKDCLYSTVKNISGQTMVFGFLPPHGVSLTSDEEYTVFGNILEAIDRGPTRVSSRRSQIAFASALSDQLISIINTPSPIFLDSSGSSKMLESKSGTLSTVAPCWVIGTSSASDSLDDAVAA